MQTDEYIHFDVYGLIAIGTVQGAERLDTTNAQVFGEDSTQPVLVGAVVTHVVRLEPAAAVNRSQEQIGLVRAATAREDRFVAVRVCQLARRGDGRLDAGQVLVRQRCDLPHRERPPRRDVIHTRSGRRAAEGFGENANDERHAEQAELAAANKRIRELENEVAILKRARELLREPHDPKGGTRP